jgi:ubiquinone/menaquinone biosynthesis C-methylase UbiE
MTLMSGRHFPLAEELAELTAAVRPSASRVVVDLGCSEGTYALQLGAEGSLVLAIDHSEAFLRRLARRAERLGLNIVPIRAVAQHLPVASGVVDAVAIGGSLNEIGDAPAALCESARITRAGGSLFLVSLMPASTRSRRAVQRALRLTGITFPSLTATVELVEAAGFSVVQTRREQIVLRLTAARR